MPSIDHYRKQAKLLMRWHREGNYSIGEKVRLIARHRHLSDREILDMSFPLALAQEIIAIKAGVENWAQLRERAEDTPTSPATGTAVELAGALPILFVRDVAKAAAFYAEKLGFTVDFLHGRPPFYAAVSRGGACLHLRYVRRPNFADLARAEQSLILATVETNDVKTLFDEFTGRDVDFAQRLVRQAWGGLDFHIRDPDGNVISFVQYSVSDAGSS